MPITPATSAKHHLYPFFQERALQHAVLSGQKAAAAKLLESMFRSMRENCESIRHLKSDAIHCTVFLVRKCIQAGMVSEGLQEAVLVYSARLIEASDSRAIHAILRELVASLLAAAGDERLRSRREKVRKAIQYIHARSRMALSLEDVAEVVGLSYSYFSRLFAEETGTTFHVYLTKIRLANAKELLLTTSLTVAEIAAQVGYEDPSHFIRVFKRCTGMTPRRFAQVHHAGANLPPDPAEEFPL